MAVLRKRKSVPSPIILTAFFFCLLSLVSEVLTNRTPQPGTFSRFLVKNESTPVGTILGMISAYDTDGPNNVTFSIPDPLTTTSQIVELRNYRQVDTYTRAMDIVLIKGLDRDFEPSERRLSFSATDGRSTIALEVTLMIQDVNDEAPLLINLPYKVTIYENQPVDSVIFSNISAFDPDNGRGSTVEYSLTTDAQGADDEYRSTFEISSTIGSISLKRKLDYERHSFYIFKVGVKDKGEPESLVGTPADFVVTVLDVQDTPPMFVNLPYTTEIMETETVGTTVLRVTGLDGDQGIPNDLSYSFVSGDYQNFDINSTTGWITVKAALDRDSPSMATNGGVYAMWVQATEIDKPGQPNYGNTTARAIVTISVQDVNDNTPEFSEIHYTAQIQENMQNGVPVTFIGDIMRVVDRDQGTNSYFALTVEKDGQPYPDFTTLPAKVYTESTVLVRVNNSEALDYESEDQIIFQVVAREIDTAERRSSTATVTLNILDMNDNAPNFTHPQYLFTVSEDASVDDSIGEILAVDDDTGSYAGVSYSIRGGNEKFRVDSMSGEVYVNGPLDRETTSQYFLSAEAIDGGGLRAPTEIEIVVTDVNDNAPLFRRSDYEGVVREKDSSFHRPIIVEAVDDDQPTSVNSLVKYRIDRFPAGLENNFTIDELSGQISLVDPLDYEKLDPALQGRLELLVVAYDLGTPRQSSSIFVNITVEDVNDFPPVFSPSNYTVSIPENSPESTSVLTVSATDDDGTSPNNDFFYRVDSGALDKFRIDFDTGEIFVETGARLDREEKQQYLLRVSATDRGNPALTGFSDVTIILTNVNDELPRFSQSSNAVTVPENKGVGQSVFSYVATDSDDDSDLRYSVLRNHTKAYDENGEKLEDADVTAQGIDDYFGVHPNNGTVYVQSALDRETAERIVIKILVEDINAASPPQQSATATLSITLSDYNDNAPTFLRTDQFYVNVSEAANLDFVILRVLTSDRDRGQQVTYELARSDADATGVDSFVLSEDTGQGTIVLQQKLDRETKPSHTFIIVAKDTGVPQQSSSATVYVTVTDENDNIPDFVAYPTVFRVSEDASIGQEVYVMTANDNDEGDFGTVVYSLEGVDSGDGSFQIDPRTGNLTVAGPLDRETKSVYRLEVLARDNDPNVVNRKSRRASLTIEVTDVNDNTPQFVPLGTTSPSVAEIAEVGKSIFTVVAEDGDEGENGKVTYELVPGAEATNATANGNPFFSIEETTGIVRVAQALHSKAGFYVITVRASDNGTERRSSTMRYLIDVYDVNDALPVFVYPDPNNAVVSVPEDEEAGLLVIQLTATDSDTGRNGEVEYTLDQRQDRNILDSFRLNATSGELTTAVRLDRESRSEFRVKVIATDHGIPRNYSTELVLTVRVRDVNDQPPMFDRSALSTPYGVSFAENVTTQRCTNVSVAVDRDSDQAFTIICYYLFGAELVNTFQLSKSGSLCLKQDQMLDREVTPFTHLIILASDDCNKVVTPLALPPSGHDPPTAYVHSNSSMLWVNVSVRDFNDFRPVFVLRDLALGITRDVQVGKIIYNLREEVIDNDTEEWGVARFTNLTAFEAHPRQLAQELAGMKVSSPFILFPNGSVKVNTYFNADMSGYFIVTVRVVDKGGLSDDADLRISLISDSQRLKVVFREGVAQVGSYRVQFAQRMSAVTRYRIVVDKVQTHENENSVAENDKTDMFIHGEDTTTNEIVPAVTLLRTIDELSANMDMIRLLNDFNVLEIVETRSQQTDAGAEKKLQMALILVSVILGVLCIILAVVLYFTYKRYSRKLKAATALAYVNSGVGPQETDLYKVDIPGTNMHTYENSNPIYLEKIMLEGDDDGQNSMDENSLTQQNLSGLDEQEVCMNIFPEEQESRNNNHRKAVNRAAYLKAAIREHDHSRNLQTNDLAKESNDDKMRMSSSSPSSSATVSVNSSVDNRGLKARGAFRLPPPARPIVVAGASGNRNVGFDDDDEGSMTCDINGLPSTEI